MLKLSIIIPVFNVSKIWNEVVIQNFDDIVRILPVEVIFIDDCSTDCTLEILYSWKSDRIKIIRNHVNRGPKYSRNIGFSNASADHVLFLDGDDTLNISILKDILESMTYLHYDVSSYAFEFVSRSGSRVFSYHFQNRDEKDLLNDYLNGNYYRVSWGRIYNKSFLVRNNIRFIEDKTHGRDLIFCFDVFQHAKTAYFGREILISSVSRDGSFSRNYTLKNVESAVRVIDDIRDRVFKEKQYFSAFKKFQLKTIAYHLMLSSLRLTYVDWRQAFIRLTKALYIPNNIVLFFTNPVSYSAFRRLGIILKINY
jgi:glycosyltransferase involved in cell wall biosynthesis